MLSPWWESTSLAAHIVWVVHVLPATLQRMIQDVVKCREMKCSVMQCSAVQEWSMQRSKVLCVQVSARRPPCVPYTPTQSITSLPYIIFSNFFLQFSFFIKFLHFPGTRSFRRRSLFLVQLNWRSPSLCHIFSIRTIICLTFHLLPETNSLPCKILFKVFSAFK